jgi:RHH-type proline utilization regulon transcriptional repressor/proline dehydrogenase/delta 1-pyrroline-5-carboxylate dehydrogenase
MQTGMLLGTGIKWRRTGTPTGGMAASTRTDCLQKAADLLEQHRLELVSRVFRRAHRKGCFGEVRSRGFCRYYAQSALELFNLPIKLPSPTVKTCFITMAGESMSYQSWNFPIAILSTR